MSVPMSRTEVISVLMAFDSNYAPHAAACLASLVRHSHSDIDVVIASSKDQSSFAERIRQSFTGYDRITIEFRLFELPASSQFPLAYTLTVDAYLRLWIGDMMTGRSRALYLDPDTIVTGPIEELWQTDLRNNVLAAVPIPNSARPKEHGMPPGSLFFNSGVLLVDLEAWRSRNYRDRCLAYLQAHPERAIDADQDILNLVTAGDWLALDYRWNVISPFYRPSSHDLGLPQRQIRHACDDARIVHFNGAHKPWTYLDDHPRKIDYLSSRAQTDWRDWRPADRTLLNICRKHLGPYLPRWAKRNVKALAKLANPRT